MGARKRIVGSHRIARQAGEKGVDVRAIQHLPPPFRVLPYADAPIIGRAPKSFVVLPSETEYGHAYIAKRPSKDHTGDRECVTEYLIARIGKMLPLRVADARLARIPDGGRPQVHFMSRYFLDPKRDHLRHGIELFSVFFDVDHETLHQEVGGKGDHERAFYTLDMVDELLGTAAGGDPSVHAQLRDGFARMLAFDALVGSQDRHLQNWGIVENVWGRHPPRFAPIFDTARGLFLHMDDASLASRMSEPSFVPRYAARAKPLIGTGHNPSCNHFELAAFMVRDRAALYRGSVHRVVDGFDSELCQRMMQREFARLFSRVRLELVAELLRYRHRILRGILRGEPLEAVWASETGSHRR
jgi:hypothetical protein